VSFFFPAWAGKVKATVAAMAQANRPARKLNLAKGAFKEVLE
jgi:hypothetical protein